MQAAASGHQTQAFFLPCDETAPASQRFCLWHTPLDVPTGGARAPRALLVLVPPFAEEMNKSRRMAALQCRAFAEAGFAVLQLDLLGCGDSGGDFADATWAVWVSDVLWASQLALQRFARDWPGLPNPPLWLWGVRAGCLLACAAAAAMDGPVNFLFWQAPSSGKTVLQQFLRLKVAASLAQADNKGVAGQLRQEIAAHRSVNIAGYELAPALANGLEAARLVSPAAPCRMIWLEVSIRPQATLLPVSQTAVQQWRDAGHEVREAVVVGPAFWSTVEIEDAPALVNAGTQLLAQALAPAQGPTATQASLS